MSVGQTKTANLKEKKNKLKNKNRITKKIVFFGDFWFKWLTSDFKQPEQNEGKKKLKKKEKKEITTKKKQEQTKSQFESLHLKQSINKFIAFKCQETESD